MYDAFELDQIKDGHTLRIATKGNLVIAMHRSEPESK
ncbi:DUF4752 family protein [Xenorhabdus stockiae]